MKHSYLNLHYKIVYIEKNKIENKGNKKSCTSKLENTGCLRGCVLVKISLVSGGCTHESFSEAK